jgi:hypothetical protein
VRILKVGFFRASCAKKYATAFTAPRVVHDAQRTPWSFYVAGYLWNRLRLQR